MRALDWVAEPGAEPSWIRLLDQTALPSEEVVLQIRTVDQLVEAIARLAVRGAPALGVAGAMGVALALQNGTPDVARAEIARLRAARPTAVNLGWGVDRVMKAFDQGFDAALTVALGIRDDDIESSRQMALRGYDALVEMTPDAPQGLTLMTICNTGSLAAVEGGTALGVIAEVFRRGTLRNVVACETRPLLQGARLTAWELARMGAPHQTVVDSAANFLTARGGIDAILVGADRIAANGDSANKIGTFSLALGAKFAGIPFLVVAPESTVDLSTASGDLIEIEDRGSEEVTVINGCRMSPTETTSINPAFDVTPASLITGIVTEARVIRPSRGEQPSDPIHNDPSHSHR